MPLHLQQGKISQTTQNEYACKAANQIVYVIYRQEVQQTFRENCEREKKKKTQKPKKDKIQKGKSASGKPGQCNLKLFIFFHACVCSCL